MRRILVECSHPGVYGKTYGPENDLICFGDGLGSVGEVEDELRGLEMKASALNTPRKFIERHTSSSAAGGGTSSSSVEVLIMSGHALVLVPTGSGKPYTS